MEKYQRPDLEITRFELKWNILNSSTEDFPVVPADPGFSNWDENFA